MVQTSGNSTLAKSVGVVRVYVERPGWVYSESLTWKKKETSGVLQHGNHV
jgi:hypothetical protein